MQCRSRVRRRLETQPAAQLWWRSLLGCLSIPVLQAIFFSTGVDLLLSPDHNIPILLLGAGAGPTPSTDVFNLFIAACLLWVTVRIPRLIGRYVTHALMVNALDLKPPVPSPL